MKGTLKKLMNTFSLNNKNVPSHYEVILDSLKWFTGTFFSNFIWSVTFHDKFKSVFYKLFLFLISN